MKHIKGSIPSLVLMPCRQTDRLVHKGRGWRCKASAKIQNSVPISVPRPLFELTFIYLPSLPPNVFLYNLFSKSYNTPANHKIFISYLYLTVSYMQANITASQALNSNKPLSQ